MNRQNSKYKLSFALMLALFVILPYCKCVPIALRDRLKDCDEVSGNLGFEDVLYKFFAPKAFNYAIKYVNSSADIKNEVIYRKGDGLDFLDQMSKAFGIKYTWSDRGFVIIEVPYGYRHATIEVKTH